MEHRNFRKLLEGRWRRDCMVCVGLDPDWEKIPSGLKTLGGQERDPAEVILDFNQKIIEATADVTGAYKPQSAYYEKWGAAGFAVLKKTVEYLDQNAPGTPRILDAKRADGIDRTNRGYVDSIFGHLGFDAVTLHPYLGGIQALRPFLDQRDKGLIVLCRTSNRDAGEFQDLPVALDKDQIRQLLSGPVRTCTEENALVGYSSRSYQHVPLYKIVALRVANYWNAHGNCCLVVGATYPREAQEIRRLVGDDVYFLVPGVGAQGGDVASAVNACRNSRREGFIISSSSGIIHASQKADFAQRAREQAMQLNAAINRCRKEQPLNSNRPVSGSKK